MFGRIPGGGFSQMFSRPHSEGPGTVALAAAMPLAVLALARTRPRSLRQRRWRGSRTSRSTTTLLRDKSQMPFSWTMRLEEPECPMSL
jgi:hypothetical protein